MLVEEGDVGLHYASNYEIKLQPTSIIANIS